MENAIYIRSHELCYLKNSCRLVTHIEELGKPYDLFFEVDLSYAPFLVTETADAAVYLVLMYALRNGYDIISDIPVTSEFMHNIKEVLIPSLMLGDNTLHQINIVAPLVDIDFHGQAVGTAVSCGVDSFYTIKQYLKTEYRRMKLTHLFITSSSVDLWQSNAKDLDEYKKHFPVLFDRYSKVAQELNLPLVVGYSNYMEYLYNVKRIRYHQSVHHYITMANILCLRKLWRIYYFSSSEPFTIFDLIDNSKKATSRHELLSMHILSLPDFNCYSTGGSISREDKTIALADFEVATKYLHPCFRPNTPKNCSNPSCAKCLRALLALDIHDKLPLFTQVFDIDKYTRNKIKYFTRACELKNDDFIGPLYPKLQKKYPELMKRAQVVFAKQQQMESYWSDIVKNISGKLPKNLSIGKNLKGSSLLIQINQIDPKIHYQLTYKKNHLLIGFHCHTESLLQHCEPLLQKIESIYNNVETIRSNNTIDIKVPVSNISSELINFFEKTNVDTSALQAIEELKAVPVVTNRTSTKPCKNQDNYLREL